MGYKIAGYDVIGCNEIDPRMMKCYETNHQPQYIYLEDIRDLVRRNNLPEELYNLDILDGSPPVSYTHLIFIQPGFKGRRIMVPDTPAFEKNKMFNFYNNQEQ